MSFKEGIIRQVEQTIDRNNKKAAELEEELQAVWDETEEARDTLHFLKTGKERPVREAPPERQRTTITRINRDRYREVINERFGHSEFTARQLAEAVGIDPASSAAGNMAASLVKECWLVRVRQAVTGGTNPIPALYRRYR